MPEPVNRANVKPLDDKALRREAIAWYETASLAFHRHRYLDVDEDEGGGEHGSEGMKHSAATSPSHP